MKLYPNIQFAVLQDRAMSPHLAAFMDSVAHWRPFTEAVPWGQMHTVRNRAFRWFLEETRVPWLVMCDVDTVWTEASIPLLESMADVASAAFARAGDGQDGHPSTMSVGAIKLSRRAVERLGECWVAPPGPDKCECPAFYQACLAAGLEPVKAGVVGHRVHVTVWPGKCFQLDSEVRVLK